MPRSLIVAFFCAGFTAACGPSGEHAVLVATDSSGVAIVENARPAWKPGDGGELSNERVLSLGVREGAPEQQLDRVTDALRLPDGSIVVANEGSAELRYFAADGRFLDAAGRAGDGPGEVRAIARLWPARGDTVVAYDPLLKRLTSFARAGRLAGSVALGA